MVFFKGVLAAPQFAVMCELLSERTTLQQPVEQLVLLFLLRDGTLSLASVQYSGKNIRTAV